MAEPIAVGASASLDHVVAAHDVAVFARLSGDHNPIHLDPGVARAAGFEGAVAHGMLVAALISRLLGTELPGPGTILLGQTLRYLRPVYPGDALRATVEITHIREDKPVITLHTWIESHGNIVLDGEATVITRELAKR